MYHFKQLKDALKFICDFVVFEVVCALLSMAALYFFYPDMLHSSRTVIGILSSEVLMLAPVVCEIFRIRKSEMPLLERTLEEQEALIKAQEEEIRQLYKTVEKYASEQK